jgi:hypothetical protein
MRAPGSSVNGLAVRASSSAAARTLAIANDDLALGHLPA